MSSRREFLQKAAATALAATAGEAGFAETRPRSASPAESVSLCGEWDFRIDNENSGTKEAWYRAEHPAADWRKVEVPHTWQIDADSAEYRGLAWYRRTFDVPLSWQSEFVRIEFEAVFHSATVWVNGQQAGEHLRKGYTAFALDISRLLRPGHPNVLVVRVDNTFDEHMLPRGRSSDWAHDGGIFRPVQLIVTPPAFVERVDVEALPDAANQDGQLAVTAYCRNGGSKTWQGRAALKVIDEETGLEVLANPAADSVLIKPGATQVLKLSATLSKAKLWHFDHPHLYRLELSIANEASSHNYEAGFGVRRLEVKDGGFYLNGEKVRLMGVERMAGSNPQFGMAEPGEWIDHDHRDLKHLNCIFTRVHWPQDRRVLDYCDRHGILMQSEIPTWGPDTFKGMGAQPDADILQNGLEQLREMMSRDRNHPSIVVWGLCNEIGGQNPPAYQFAKHMLEEAKKLDPNRLCSYASHSLRETPQRDAAGLMDFIETNEYFGSWQKGDAASLEQHLDDLHAAFPGKPIVISEYGYCACTADRPEGDGHRVEVLGTHDAALRSRNFVGGAIFFCYNDYRTHVGDRGAGVLKQRVHGVVDVYGRPKPSYSLLRQESSPVEFVVVENHENVLRVRVRNRSVFPMYTLRSYRLRATFYGQGDIPVEQREVELSDLSPGAEATAEISFGESEAPLHVVFDVLRPTRFSAFSLDWRP